jgi:ATP/maltotriose-dependent transcriptional regulator MalT
LSYFGYYWIGEGKLGRAREYLLRSVDASTSIGYHVPLAWSVGQLSMCASLQGRFSEMLQQAELCEVHATPGDSTYLANKCSQVLALVRLGRIHDANERLATLPAPSASDSPLTLAIRAATSAALEMRQGRLTSALVAADRVHRLLPWASQVPPVWPDVLTNPIEVYLAAWQAARDARGADAGRLARVARRRIRALRSWGRLFPVARPIADYFTGRAEWLAGRVDQSAALFQRAQEGARARGLSHYEALSADALATLRRPLQTSAM